MIQGAIYVSILSLITFFMFGLDKQKARADTWRIKESSLLLLCTIGGSIGGLLGMYIFHHKTHKPRFKFGVPLILFLQVLLLLLINMR